MKTYEKIFVPEKYEIFESSSPEKEIGELVHLDLNGSGKNRHRDILLKVIALVFIISVIATLFFAVITDNDALVLQVFEKCSDLMLIVIAFYFGIKHGESKEKK